MGEAIGLIPAGAVTLRLMTRADLPLLSRWLAAPHVAQWWREDPSPESVEAGYGRLVDAAQSGEPAETVLYMVEVEGVPVGMIQATWLEHEPQWAAALGVDSDVDLDFLIGEANAVGRGVGPTMLEKMSLEIFKGAVVTAVSSAPQQANRRSWRALEKAGFDRVREVEDLGTGDPSDEGPAYVYLRRR